MLKESRLVHLSFHTLLSYTHAKQAKLCGVLVVAVVVSRTMLTYRRINSLNFLMDMARQCPHAT